MVCRDIKELSMCINVLAVIFHNLPYIYPYNNTPQSPMDRLEEVTMFVHPLVDLHQTLNTLQHKGQVGSHW